MSVNKLNGTQMFEIRFSSKHIWKEIFFSDTSETYVYKQGVVLINILMTCNIAFVFQRVDKLFGIWCQLVTVLFKLNLFDETFFPMWVITPLNDFYCNHLSSAILNIFIKFHQINLVISDKSYFCVWQKCISMWLIGLGVFDFACCS